MAGKRQHYVPRLLQRGFLADPGDEGERAWLHRLGETPKLVGIRDIGVEDWFYSRRSADGQPTLDDEITELEQDLQKDVASFRSATLGTVVSSAIAAPLVAHLATRTAHIRAMMAQLLSAFSDGAIARLGMRIGVQ
ncbi:MULTISPECIES: hypothetical protein [unclassified Phenylobacterium]|uniref:hypothetical protein n=1 Tax=unclassified Phenylobacterium TaxID=2640670 RepID=UPI00083A4D56|nr:MULTISPECIES: hypothetical protein [unclassified Phenylobacterium]